MYFRYTVTKRALYFQVNIFCVQKKGFPPYNFPLNCEKKIPLLGYYRKAKLSHKADFFL